MPFFSAAERSATAFAGHRWKSCRWPCVHSWAHGGAWRRRSSSVVGVRPSLWVMALIAAAARGGKKSERRTRVLGGQHAGRSGGSPQNLAACGCGDNGVEWTRWSTLLSVVDSFGGQGGVGQRPPTVTCCQFVHRVRSSELFLLSAATVRLSERVQQPKQPTTQASFWSAQPN
jgi:hypothetical protein